MLWSSHGFHDVEMAPHAHDMHELFVCLNDNGSQHVGGRVSAFRRGAAFFLYSGVPHHLSHTRDKPGEYIFVCFDRNHFLDAGQEKIHRMIFQGLEEKMYFSGLAPEYLADNIATAFKLHEELKSPKAFSEEKARALLEILVVDFFRSVDASGPAETGSDESRMRELLRGILKDPSVHMSLDEAAASAGMSRAKFTRKFRRAHGAGFCEYLLDLRLKKACELLAEKKDMPVASAAFLVGFNNLGYFHRAFKRRFGRTPLQARKIFMENRHPSFLRVYDDSR